MIFLFILTTRKTLKINEKKKLKKHIFFLLPFENGKKNID